MFKRIPWDTVLADLRVAGMVLLTVAFLILLVRMISMRRDEADKFAKMPLDD